MMVLVNLFVRLLLVSGATNDLADLKAKAEGLKNASVILSKEYADTRCATPISTDFVFLDICYDFNQGGTAGSLKWVVNGSNWNQNVYLNDRTCGGSSVSRTVKYARCRSNTTHAATNQKAKHYSWVVQYSDDACTETSITYQGGDGVFVTGCERTGTATSQERTLTGTVAKTDKFTTADCSGTKTTHEYIADGTCQKHTTAKTGQSSGSYKLYTVNYTTGTAGASGQSPVSLVSVGLMLLAASAILTI